MDSIWTQSALGKASNKMRNDYEQFKYLWSAKFANGHIVRQHPNDLYSKHNPKAQHNPSSFRDFLDYVESHPDVPVVEFKLSNKDKAYTVGFEQPGRPVIYYDENNKYGIPTKHYEWFKCKRDLTNIRPIYYRQMEMDLLTGEKHCLGFVIGFQGNESNGNNYQKTINVL